MAMPVFLDVTTLLDAMENYSYIYFVKLSTSSLFQIYHLLKLYTTPISST